MSDPNHSIAVDDLTGFVAALFERSDVPKADAALWAKVLVWAESRGVSSHGVMRVATYLDQISKSEIDPRARLEVVQAGISSVIIDAHLAPGPVAMDDAARRVLSMAEGTGVGWCAVRQLTHPGAIGYFARQIAEAGMIGICMSASQPLMSYQGARVAGVSTNPIAIAVPDGGSHPLMLDMATSNASLGKVMNARETKRAVPLDWGLDLAGSPTTDPDAIAVLQPLGGAKGSGLSLMIECLTSLFVGMPLIAPALSGKPPVGRPMNALVAAISVGNATGFADHVQALRHAIVSLPRADEDVPVVLPGQRGDRVAERSRKDGIVLPRRVANGLRELGMAAGLDVAFLASDG